MAYRTVTNNGRVSAKRPSVLRPRLILTDIAFIGVVFALHQGGTAGALASYAVLIFYSLRSTERALLALLLSGLITMMAGSPVIPRSSVIGYMKFVVVAAVFARVFLLSKDVSNKMPLQLVALLGFSILCAFLAIYNEYFTEVALLKIVSFTVAASVSLAIIGCHELDQQKILSQLLALSLITAGLSLFFAAVGTVSVARISGAGSVLFFKGIYNHPQAAGVIYGSMAVMWAFALVHLGFQDALKRWVKVGYLLFGAFVLGAYLSGARTAILGSLLAIVLTLVLFSISHAETLRFQRASIDRLKNPLLVAGFAVVLLGLLGQFDLQSTWQNFMDKGEQLESTSPIAAFMSSREALINYNFEQFWENPMTGVGFGLDTSERWQAEATLLSASTERGFWPGAVLAETGVFGFALFCFFCIVLIRKLLRAKCFVALSVWISTLVFNLAEMSMFAIGGVGAISWALIGYAAMLDRCFKVEDTSKNFRHVVG